MSGRWTLKTFDRNLQVLKTKKVHLEQLRFPNYRNIRPDQILRFCYPITVLLGCNGTNKSSILQAVYGTGKGKSIGEYWFETALDAIPQTDSAGRKQSVAHAYRDQGGNSMECLKARAPRQIQDPDYWEAVKPTQVYGFPANAARTAPISIHIEYLDFRQVLPAFDKYFYFPDARHLARRIKYAKATGGLRRSYRPQDYLRHRAPVVKRMLAQNGKDLSAATLEAASYVLGRQYTSGRHLEHSIYWGHTGTTLILQTKNFSIGYSDAYAGSGESAAITLIETIERVPAGSLIVLDEPETSLHILAQQRMLKVLTEYAVRKDLQFVVATHSDYFANPLPKEAIKLLHEDRSDGKICIIDGLSAREALHDTAELERGKTILVEDERAQSMVLAAFSADGGNLDREFEVRVCAGGVPTMLMHIKALCATGRSEVLVIFDGDQRPARRLDEEGTWPTGKKELQTLIEQQTKGGNKSGQDMSFRDASECQSFLRFLNRNVTYLPGGTPESVVWVQDHVREAFSVYFKNGQDWLSEVDVPQDCKEKIRLLADMIPGLKSDAVYGLLLARLMKTDLPNATSIKKDLVDWVRNHAS